MIEDTDGVVHVVLDDYTHCGLCWYDPEQYRIVSGWAAHPQPGTFTTCLACAGALWFRRHQTS